MEGEIREDRIRNEYVSGSIVVQWGERKSENEPVSMWMVMKWMLKGKEKEEKQMVENY